MKNKIAALAVLLSLSIWHVTLAAGNVASLRVQIEKIAAGFAGDVGVATKNIETNETVEVNGRALFPMASTYKVAIMTEVFRQAEAGKFSLKERVELTEESKRAGSGLLAHFDAGVRPTIHDLMLLMMSVSDNTATDMLLDRVGASNVTSGMRAAGLTAIRIDRPTKDLLADYSAELDPRLRTAPASEVARIRESLTPERVREANLRFSDVNKDVTTPSDMTELLAKIFKGEIVSKTASDQMMQILSHNQILTRLQRYLPDGGRIYSKYGSVAGSINDVGIMYVGRQHVAISVYIKNKRVDRYQAEAVIGRVSRAVYDYYSYTQAQ